MNEGDFMYGAELGIVPVAGITQQNPQLALAEDGLYRAGEKSPIINALKIGAYSVKDDMDAQPRPQGNRDAGADEVSKTPIRNKPLQPSDVGPEWLNASE
jgi:poly(beta-D-mannuronate) lyase